MRSAVLAAMLLAACAPAALAASAEVPDYDTDAYCHRVATTNRLLSRDKLEFCLRTEHSALGAVMHRRSRLLAERSTRCSYVASSAGPDASGQGSYGSFVTCLEGRDDAGREAP